MKREIKFRAWDKDSKKMIKGDEPYGKYNEELGVSLDGEVLTLDFETYYPSIGFSNDVEIMQFTGLKDKNEVQIYQGDIIAVNYGKEDDINPADVNTNIEYYEVIFENGMYGAEGGESLYHYINNYEVEVIGNIYQNPELIK